MYRTPSTNPISTLYIVFIRWTYHVIIAICMPHLPCLLSSRISELENRVAYECVQLHGGWGYMWEYPVCKTYVDARVQPIYGGSNEIMKELIARTVVSE